MFQGLFGDSVNTVVSRFREAKRHKEDFVKFHTQPEHCPSQNREAQKQSMASHATLSHLRKRWFGSMEATVKSVSLDAENHRKRLQNRVSVPPSALQWRGLHYCEIGTSALAEAKTANSAGQRGHRTCSPPRQTVRLLQPLFFWFLKKMEGCVQFWTFMV